MYLYFDTYRVRERKKEERKREWKKEKNVREKDIYITYICIYIINKFTSFHDIQGDTKYEVEALGQHGRTLTFKNSIAWNR